MRMPKFLANLPLSVVWVTASLNGAVIPGRWEKVNAQSPGTRLRVFRTGQPQNEAKTGGNFFEILYSDPVRLKGFCQAMTGLSMGATRAIAEKFPWKNYSTFIDIGTAQGGLPVTVAGTHEHLTGGGFDLPVVKPIFEEYVCSNGLQGSAAFLPRRFPQRSSA